MNNSSVRKSVSFGISRNVFVLGLVSFFNDVASEMIYPIVPIFLTGVLGAPVYIVGLVEGIAEATASILKVVSGWISDKLRKRKPLVLAGYSFSAISKILLGLAYTWQVVLLSRFIDRFGKGTRTSARDALIAENSETSSRAKAFGFHRALDTAGAVAGPLLSLLAIKFLNDNLRTVFFLAFIPSFIGILLLIFFVSEKRNEKIQSVFPDGNTLNRRNQSWDPSFKIFLAISAVFAIGNSSDAFLILRAKDLGLSVTSVVLAYVLFNFSYAIFSMPAGILADKIGPRKVLLTGFMLFSLVYILFGFAGSGIFIWILFPVYGLYMALTEGVGKAYISNLVPCGSLATAMGIYQTTVGLCTFFASMIAGALWDFKGVAGAPFIFGGIMAALAGFLFWIIGKKNNFSDGKCPGS